MNPHHLTDADRSLIGQRLAHEQRTRFGGSKKAAYIAAGVNPATWERALNGQPIRADRFTAIVSGLWPTSDGDWDRIPGQNQHTPEPDDLEMRLQRIEARLLQLEQREEGDHGGDTAATKAPGESPGTVTELPRRGQTLDNEAARDVGGRESKADRGRRRQDAAGEPGRDNPDDDMEPR